MLVLLDAYMLRDVACDQRAASSHETVYLPSTTTSRYLPMSQLAQRPIQNKCASDQRVPSGCMNMHKIDATVCVYI